jgi:hypothetical protein
MKQNTKGSNNNRVGVMMTPLQVSFAISREILIPGKNIFPQISG